MSFYGKELQSRLSWRQWKQDMSDKITKNVIDECNTHTMCLAETFPEEKTKTEQNGKNGNQRSTIVREFWFQRFIFRKYN